ncbi:YTH domain-containing protein 1-like [Drosophila subpulchrella]|uniref:YTH domain-containing protein 1-like n=1 Tax=Drosophila subpulchrella TaxID=1486046 RepID=UPI0018A19B8A|nr:YTH domain-containing protein 1-like [Drosophila subpulchrella]
MGRALPSAKKTVHRDRRSRREKPVPKIVHRGKPIEIIKRKIREIRRILDANCIDRILYGSSNPVFINTDFPYSSYIRAKFFCPSCKPDCNDCNNYNADENEYHDRNAEVNVEWNQDVEMWDDEYANQDVEMYDAEHDDQDQGEAVDEDEDESEEQEEEEDEDEDEEEEEEEEDA